MKTFLKKMSFLDGLTLNPGSSEAFANRTLRLFFSDAVLCGSTEKMSVSFAYKSAYTSHQPLQQVTNIRNTINFGAKTCWL